jgi:hypothetical protein
VLLLLLLLLLLLHLFLLVPELPIQPRQSGSSLLPRRLGNLHCCNTLRMTLRMRRGERCWSNCTRPRKP